MQILDLEQFLYDVSWSDNVRHKIRVMADRDDLRYLLAYNLDGKLSCAAFTDKPDSFVDVIAIWSKRGDDPTVPAEKSRTMQAIDLVLDEGLTVYAASKQVGVNESAVHRALGRRKDKQICPCCNQVIRR
jgi:hypothetical protein